MAVRYCANIDCLTPMIDGYYPVCSKCGEEQKADIPPWHYKDNKSYWDNWVCWRCNGGGSTRFERVVRKGSPWVLFIIIF